MKWELSTDETLMLVSGITAVVPSVHFYAAPRHFHKTYFPPDQVCNEMMTKWCGMTLSIAGGQMLTVGLSKPDKKTLKNSLKFTGAAWLVASAQHAYNTHAGYEKKCCYALAGVQAVLGALCLKQGFKKPE